MASNKYLHMYVLILHACVYTLFAENSCPSLNDPENGKMFQFSDGNIAIFSCDDGYTKKGNSFLHCVNGNWSSLAPTCLKSL